MVYFLQINYAQRRAVTLLEVLFATIVIVVGLLGIATLIPFAARDAQTANNHTQALSLGLGWAESFYTRELHRPSPSAGKEGYGWRWYRDFNFGGNPPAWEDFVVGIPSFSSFSDLGTNKVNRLWGFTPVCLDPYTMTSTDRLSLFRRYSTDLPGAPHSSTAYRPSVFPYYEDGYDPQSDPLSPTATVYDQPRMLRATLGFGEPLVGSPVTVVTRKVVESLFGSADDLVADEYIDPALALPESDYYPARRLFSSAVSDPAIAVAGQPALKSLTDGRYTWMATIVPYEPTGIITESALVSFLILHRHNHTIDFTARPTVLGERSLNVTPLSGNFIGGAGGRVSVSTSADTDDTLEVGNWIMLGRFFTNPSNPADTNLYPYFRWYRIIGLDQQTTINGGAWSRTLVLDGPDFDFNTGNPALATYGTIVGGVITVVERQVKLQ